jgi:aminomethyltransferase
MEEQGLHKSVMYEVQEKMGATFTSFWGWIWSDSFGDLKGEHRAVRQGVGVADVSALIKWNFTGSDALAAAQRLCTNDILGLEPGQVRYGPFLDSAGRMIDDGTVYMFSNEHCWVMTNRSDLTQHFTDATKGLTVSIEDVTLEMPLLQVQGPKSRDLLSGLADADLSSLRYFRFLPERIHVAEVPVWISRTGFTGELGYELFVDPEAAPNLWVRLVEAGATPYGAAVADIQRIESGIVVYELDYDPGALTPYDVSFDRLVALHRPFLGRESIADIADHPPRRMKTLRIDGDQLPARGDPISVEGQVRGKVTSPTMSPEFGAIALAILESDVAADGTEVVVGETPDAGSRASVAPLPIYDPDKLRPRV